MRQAALIILVACAAHAAAEPVVETYEDGRVRARYTVDDQGRRIGPYTEYDRDGAIIADQVWVEGELIWPKSKRLILSTIRRINTLRIEGVDNEHIEALRRLMIYRFLCDVPYEGMRLDDEMALHARAAAAISRRISALSHAPPNPGVSDEEYRMARIGAANCNLAYGMTLADSIHAYMQDSDPLNIATLPHRRWCLSPRMAATGFGEAGLYSAMWRSDRGRKHAEDYEFIAYPPRGFLPVRYYKDDIAWSVSLNGGKYLPPSADDVTISVRAVDSGALQLEALPTNPPLDIDYQNVDRAPLGLANCIVFRPVGVDAQPRQRYFVTIRGLRRLDGSQSVVEYMVEFM